MALKNVLLNSTRNPNGLMNEFSDPEVSVNSTRINKPVLQGLLLDWLLVKDGSDRDVKSLLFLCQLMGKVQAIAINVSGKKVVSFKSPAQDTSRWLIPAIKK